MIDPTGCTSFFFHAYSEGLTASLRAIAGAVMVSKHFDLPLSLQWSDRVTCPGELEDWLEQDDWTLVFEDPPNSFSLHAPDRLAGSSPTYVAHMHILKDVMTREDFDAQARAVIQAWRLKPRLQQSVTALERAHKLDQRVGIHIRRSDKTSYAKRLKWHFEDDEVLAAMQTRLDTDPDTKFFLATCTPESQSVYRRAFPSHVAISPHGFHNNEHRRRTDISAAVVDLWALSKCAELWGSQGSAFTDFAEELMGRKAFRFGKADQDAPSWCQV